MKPYEKYLGSFVYGGIDGCITTFAVVSGSVGAELSSGLIIVLGFANLLADGFSMSIGAYLSAKSERQYAMKSQQGGPTGTIPVSPDDLSPLSDDKSPVKTGLVTYVSFILVGLIPMLIYVWDYFYPVSGSIFFLSALFTAFGFIIIGVLKAHVTGSSILRSLAETLLLGVVAAAVAYGVGDWLKDIVL